MTASRAEDSAQQRRFRRARREAWVILAAALLFPIWVNLWCWWATYRHPAGPEALLWGLPPWVFWGVAIPWIAANLFTFWFALCYFREDPSPETLRKDRGA